MEPLAIPTDPLRRRPLGAQIADQLRQEILLGRLSPGTPVSQERLCEHYGTSRMPVRDALVTLTNEGLVITTPGGHSVVAGLSRADIVDVFDIGAIAHGRAARRAVANAEEDDVAALRELHEGMVGAERDGDLDLLTDLNWRFHRQINRLSRSPKLLAAIRCVSFDIPRSYLKELPGWASRVNREHGEIVDAIAAGDADAAEQVVHGHLREAGKHLADYLERLGRFDDPAPPGDGSATALAGRSRGRR